jgi:hypothetical protein
MPSKNAIANQFERTSYWCKLSRHVRRMNPICAFIDPAAGEQCTHYSECVHHLIAPQQDWELRATVSNLVALCWKHHPNTEGDDGRNEYAPTREVCVTTGVEILHQHPKGTGRAAIMPTGDEGRQGVAFTLPTKVIDAALDGIESLDLEEF